MEEFPRKFKENTMLVKSLLSGFISKDHPLHTKPIAAHKSYMLRTSSLRTVMAAIGRTPKENATSFILTMDRLAALAIGAEHATG